MLPTCPALYTMASGKMDENDSERRGWVFELAVGAESIQFPGELFYWREKPAEVDFVFKPHGKLYAIEVKSGRKKSAKGLDAFVEKFPNARRIVITPENFLQFSHERLAFLEKLAVWQHHWNRSCADILKGRSPRPPTALCSGGSVRAPNETQSGAQRRKHPQNS